MKEPLISVIVPVYNVEKYLIDCINSILEQSYHNLEILLIDDGSTDSSGKLCDEFSKKDNRIIVIHKKNGGLSDARNVGLDNHTGKYFCFVDSDDLIEKDFVKKLFNLISSGPYQLAQVGTKVVSENNRKVLYEIKVAKSQIKLNRLEFCKELLLTKVHMAAWCNLYSSKAFEGVRFTKGKLNEDMLMWSRGIDRINNVIISSQCLYRYRQREGSIVHSSKPKLYKACLENSKVWLEKVYNNYSKASAEAEVNYFFYLEMYVKSNGYSDYKTQEKKYFKENFSAKILLTNRYLSKKQKIFLMNLYYNNVLFVEMMHSKYLRSIKKSIKNIYTIQSKYDLKYFLEQDKKALYVNYKRPHLFKDEIWRFEILLRKNEYATNCLKSKIFLPYKLWIKYRFHRQSLKLGFSIPPNRIGPGLSIAHYGTIVIGYAKIGKNLRIQEGVNIGATGGSPNAATIGDNVFIGTGAKIIGDIKIADNVTIGANAVVVKDILEPSITVAGVPAKKVSSHGSLSFINAELLKR